VQILDQTLLPVQESYRELNSVEEVAEAIRTLRVRGAPLIGIAAAMGVVLAVRKQGSGKVGKRESGGDGLKQVDQACRLLAATRPTAVNLQWALDRMQRRAARAVEQHEPLRDALIAEANAIWEEDRAMCERIGELGAALMPISGTVCTICNAGALATGGIGTALAPVYTLQRAGRSPHVVVPETRPLLQGSRLTAWELTRAGIACTVIADGMIASRLRLGDVGCVVVGADRIAANGDVANKIGTYTVAVLAREHDIPFYVAAPVSTIDLSTPDGAHIPIEERDQREVSHFGSSRVTPEGAQIRNPAFDVTPHRYITGIITEYGICHPPYQESLRRVVQQSVAPARSG
jgi:methylthioribose-1-phosphate isomerase